MAAWNKAADAAHACVLVARDFDKTVRDGGAYRLRSQQHRAKRKATRVAKVMI